MKVIDEIAAERERQKTLKGYTDAHDDDHNRGELALAACCYASPRSLFYKSEGVGGDSYFDPWPWEREHDNRRFVGDKIGRHVLPNDRLPRHDRRHLLIVAAALIIAEIDRFDRETKTVPFISSHRSQS